MSMVSIIFRILLLFLVLSLKQTSAQSAMEEGSGSSSTPTSTVTRSALYKKTSHEGRRLVSGIFQTTTVAFSMQCLFQCTNHVACTSINYRDDLIQDDMAENCELIQLIEGDWNEVAFIKDVRYTHYTTLQETEPENVNFCSSSPCPNNSECDAKSESCLCGQGYAGRFCDLAPLPTCYDVRMFDREAGSGNYWIQPNPDKEPIYVYCDMETEGGMWMLVYHYTFRYYDKFHTLGNAVTPRPSWPASEADIPVSTNSPVDGVGAVDYSLWEHVGRNFLIKSNINDWIVCSPENGSLVTPINGTIYCSNIKNITSTCSGFVPKKIVWTPCGPKLFAQKTMYYFDGSTTRCWPTHNPCVETWRDNHKKGVEDAGGFIFLRP